MCRIMKPLFIVMSFFIIQSNYCQSATRSLKDGYTRKDCFENSIFQLVYDRPQGESNQDYEQYEIYSDSMALLCRISKLNGSNFDISYYGFSDDPGVSQQNLKDDGGLLVSFIYDERKKSLITIHLLLVDS